MDLIKSKKLPKSSTDVNQNFTSTNRSQYIAAIKGILFDEYSTPSSESVRYFIRRLSSTTQPEPTVDQLRPIVKEAYDAFVDDQHKLQKSAGEMKIGETSHKSDDCYSKVIREDSFFRDEEFEKFFVVDVT